MKRIPFHQMFFLTLCVAFSLVLSAAATHARPSPEGEIFKKTDKNFFRLSKKTVDSLTIIIPQNASADEIEAANILKKYLSLAFAGADMKIISGNNVVADAKTISISKNPKARPITPLLSDFSDTVSNTIIVAHKKIEILYSFSPKTAVGDFLNQIGFRFYTPNPLGLKIPQGEVSISCGTREYSPHFLSIDITGLEDSEWLYLNGGKKILEGKFHNLSGIFDDEAYKEHPEFIPQAEMFRNTRNAQPNFMAPRASNFAAKAAIKHFENNPGSRFFQIGINDSTVYDKRTKQNPAPLEFFRNYPNYSDAYFTFAAATARLVAEKYPEKFIGSLAYLNTESVPNFTLPGNIFPYLASDRASNFDAQKRDEDFKLIKLWADSGVKIAGIYDYLNGAPYLVPRNIERFVWEGVLFAKKAGIRAYFAETTPDWPYDGAKLWVLMRILNGENRSPEALESEFYKNMYPNSHKAVKRFFREAKDAWEKRTDIPYWISFYKRDTVAELFPQQRLKKMDDALALAETLAKSKMEKARLLQLRLSFEITKAFCAHYSAQKAMFELSEKSATSEILNALNASKIAKEKLFETRAVRDALNAYKTPKNNYAAEFAGPVDALALSAHKTASKEEKNRLKNILGEDIFKNLSDASGPRETIFFTSFNFPDFLSVESGIKKFPPDFRTISIPKKESEFRIAKTDDTYFALIKNCTYAEISNFFPADSNALYSFKFDAETRISLGATAYASIVFVDEKNTITERRSVSIPPMETDEMRAYEILMRAPENSKYAVTAIIVWDMHNESDFMKIKRISFQKCAGENQ